MIPLGLNIPYPATGYSNKKKRVLKLESERSVSFPVSFCANPPPAYLEVDLDNLKATLVRAPQVEEIPVQVKIMSVIEYYAR